MTDRRERALAMAGPRIEALVVDLVRHTHGNTAIERRPLYRGDRLRARMPTPLAGVSASMELSGRMRQEVVFQVRRAREAGHSWEKIGQAMRLAPDEGRTPGEMAFEYVAGAPDAWMGHTASFGWRCRDCDHAITDRGPYHSPDDNEVGHSQQCPRLATDIDRWQSSGHDDGEVAPAQREPRLSKGGARESRSIEL